MIAIAIALLAASADEAPMRATLAEGMVTVNGGPLAEGDALREGDTVQTTPGAHRFRRHGRGPQVRQVGPLAPGARGAGSAAPLRARTPRAPQAVIRDTRLISIGDHWGREISLVSRITGVRGACAPAPASG